MGWWVLAKWERGVSPAEHPSTWSCGSDGLAREGCLPPADAYGKKPFLDREPPVSTAIEPSKRGWAAILTPDSRISAPLAVPGAWRGSEASGNLGPERTGLMANEKDRRLRLPYF
jgi:hypothetical protein